MENGNSSIAAYPKSVAYCCIFLILKKEMKGATVISGVY